MSLHKTLNRIVAHYKSDIVMIRDFVTSTYETLVLNKVLESISTI